VSELRPPSETWRWSALGLSKYRTWLALDPVESVTAGALAEHLGVTSRTTRRHLALLVEHGLVERLEDEFRRTGRDPQSLADELGVAGMAERQRQRHELERQLHAEARAAYAACSIGAPAVDPETGEIANHRRPPDPPDDDVDRAVDLLLDAFPGAVEVQPPPAEILNQPMYIDSDEWRRADNGVLAHRCETCRAVMTCRRHGDRWTCSRCRPAVAS
jgi:DNA-binding transcriptional ArsR family regulator